MSSNWDGVGEFTLTAQAVVIASGGIGGIRRWWPDRLGTPPAAMLTGVPAYVAGRMLDIADAAGVRLVNRDRMWHYTDGVANWAPVWPGHDSLGALRMLRTDPDLDSWFI